MRRQSAKRQKPAALGADVFRLFEKPEKGKKPSVPKASSRAPNEDFATYKKFGDASGKYWDPKKLEQSFRHPTTRTLTPHKKRKLLWIERPSIHNYLGAEGMNRVRAVFEIQDSLDQLKSVREYASRLEKAKRKKGESLDTLRLTSSDVQRIMRIKEKILRIDDLERQTIELADQIDTKKKKHKKSWLQKGKAKNR